MTVIKQWLEERGITEIEALVPDMAGVARGKIMPAKKYTEEEGMRLPEGVFLQTVTGDYLEDDSVMNPAEVDMVVLPDPSTIRKVPWAAEPTAQIIHDCFHSNGIPVDIAPRYVLRRVLELYEAKGWDAVVAPEVEFYLVKPNIDSDYPLEPPIGRSGRAETGRMPYSIDAVNEFDPLFEDIYDYCEQQELEVETLIHEDGAAQMEVNFMHGNALALADQVFLFKRTVREAALRHKIFATFMAKPLQNEPGSAMHLHQSVVDRKTGKNIFAEKKGRHSRLFLAHVAGLQTYLPAAMSFFAPNVNSYRRIARYHSAPINTQWGHDNRTVGLRVPLSEPQSTRVENRVPGADANVYLAIAASLACGYLGMKEMLHPSEPLTGSAYNLPYGLPRDLQSALQLLAESEPLHEVLGARFVKAYAAVKEQEYETFFQVISSWEREHLLLKV
ncbi:MAG: Gamma-glutamylputrescine synthetase PuuA [Gammaproteobacteria bacterium]|nr:Gamma-glutamylputrescine synthetase PuuA [Gammaproteobacteria bacterium]